MALTPVETVCPRCGEEAVSFAGAPPALCIHCVREDADKREESDPVESPAHYAFSNIEVIDALEEWQLGFHEANAVKYIARAGRKGGEEKRVEDLRKAVWYLERRVAQLGGAK